MEAIKSYVNFRADGEGWKGSPELPTAEEVMTERSRFLPRNQLDGPWTSKDAYLEVQYRLLRHEGIEGLRNSVNRFRDYPERKDDGIHCVYVGVSHSPPPTRPPENPSSAYVLHRFVSSGTTSRGLGPLAASSSRLSEPRRRSSGSIRAA